MEISDKVRIRELCEGFSKLTRKQRENRLKQMGILTDQDFAILNKPSALADELANHFIENVIGTFPLPLGVAINFVIDGKDYIIPMAIEETSIVAAASKTAKWIRDQGELTTTMLTQLAIGQIQIPIINNFPEAQQKISENKAHLLTSANEYVAQDLVSRGGGVRDMTIRLLARGDGKNMAVIHVLVDTCDAMGANTINQVCEFLKPTIAQLLNEEVGMCILSNLADTKLTQAKAVIHNIDQDLGRLIAEGSLFAQVDPYRAATNNKGILNGIDGILLATGNDWRAVEAGMHAYAAHSGQYTSLSRWTLQGNDLVGILQAPILVGTVGGVTRLHPVAKLCLKILGVKTSAELSRVVAAAGLVQNLAAIRALVTQGITQGHMKLHIANLAMASGASQTELPILKQQLAERLAKNKRITETDVREIMQELRKR